MAGMQPNLLPMGGRMLEFYTPTGLWRPEAPERGGGNLNRYSSK